MRKNPSLKGTDYSTYMWEKVPRQLIADAKAKAKTLEPPMPLKWVLLTLLREWVYEGQEQAQEPRHRTNGSEVTSVVGASRVAPPTAHANLDNEATTTGPNITAGTDKKGELDVPLF